MPADGVPGEWSVDDSSKVVNRYNSKKGIAFVIRNEKITEIFFYARPQDDFAAFPCATNKGITQSSTLDDVRSAYNDPSYIGRSEHLNDDGTAKTVEEFVMYAERGIEFRFVGGKLSLIGIFPPADNFDYEEIQRLMGDWLVYVRPTENRRSQTPPLANDKK